MFSNKDFEKCWLYTRQRVCPMTCQLSKADILDDGTR